MTRPIYTCRNTLQRLRECHDQHKGEQEPKMKTVRVEYTVILTGKERMLYGSDSSDPEHIQQVLEQEVQATEQPAGGKTIPASSLVVTNITELKPTGDDDIQYGDT